MVQLASSSSKEGFINLFARGRIIAYQPWWPTHARRLKVNSNSCGDSALQPLSGPCNSSWGPDYPHGPSRAERDRSVTEVEGKNSPTWVAAGPEAPFSFSLEEGGNQLLGS